MNAQHLDEMADHIVVIKLLVQKMELHQKVKHIDDVEKNLKHQVVTLVVFVGFEEGNAPRNDLIVLLVSLHKLIVITLFHNQ